MRKTGILMVASLIGAAATAVLAYIKADDIKEAIQTATEEKGEDLTKVEVAKAIVKPVAPVALSFAATAGSIVATHKIDGKTIAGLSLGVTGLGTAYKRYAREAEKILGPDGKKKLKQKLIGEKPKPAVVTKPLSNPIDEDKLKNTYYLGYGYDGYLYLSNEDIYEAEKELNYRIRANGCCTVTELLEFWDVELTDEMAKMTSYYGWGNKQLFDAVGNGVLTIETDDLSENDNGEACSIITFAVTPEDDYSENIMENKVDLPWEE